jgi:Tol biopolymer transport system component
MNPRRFVVFAIGLAALLIAQPSPTRIQAEPPGPAIIQLTNDNAIDLRPAWSPDNRSIAYQSNRGSGAFHIYVMSADGSDQRALTQGGTDDRHPVWTPDGKAILFDSSDGMQSEIWMVNVADGTRKQLTRLGALASFPMPSPDGRQMSFYAFQDETLDLWSARADGSNARRLTHNLATAQNNQCTFACHPAAWTPDNLALVYSDGNHEAIRMVQSDGSSPREIIAVKDEHNHFPWFLEDGRLGVVTEHVESGHAWTDAWAYDLKTRQRTPLQGHMSMQGPMAWSADNKKVLFHSPRSGNFEIYLVDLNAPGGIDALQGTPVPLPLAAGVKTSALPASSAADPAARGSDVFVYAAGLGLALAGIGVMGYLVWRKTSRGLQ